MAMTHITAEAKGEEVSANTSRLPFYIGAIWLFLGLVWFGQIGIDPGGREYETQTAYNELSFLYIAAWFMGTVYLAMNGYTRSFKEEEEKLVEFVARKIEENNQTKSTQVEENKTHPASPPLYQGSQKILPLRGLSLALRKPSPFLPSNASVVGRGLCSGYIKYQTQKIADLAVGL